jgi:hypothetical protein
MILIGDAIMALGRFDAAEAVGAVLDAAAAAAAAVLENGLGGSLAQHV